MKINGATRNFADHLRNCHWTVEEVFAGLKFVSGSGIEDVGHRRVTAGDDFFVDEQSNDSARAETVRNLDNTTLSRASNNTPFSARVHRKPQPDEYKKQKNQQKLFHRIPVTAYCPA